MVKIKYCSILINESNVTKTYIFGPIGNIDIMKA